MTTASSGWRTQLIMTGFMYWVMGLSRKMLTPLITAGAKMSQGGPPVVLGSSQPTRRPRCRLPRVPGCCVSAISPPTTSATPASRRQPSGSPRTVTASSVVISG